MASRGALPPSLCVKVERGSTWFTVSFQINHPGSEIKPCINPWLDGRRERGKKEWKIPIRSAGWFELLSAFFTLISHSEDGIRNCCIMGCIWAHHFVSISSSASAGNIWEGSSTSHATCHWHAHTWTEGLCTHTASHPTTSRRVYKQKLIACSSCN